MSPETRPPPRIVVIGGGIAGLSTAYLLRELGRERGVEPDLLVLERRAQAGGATRTDRGEGYLCEWGPNGFLDNEPATLKLVERLGMNERLVRASEQASNRYIYHHGKLRNVPTNPAAFLRSNILPLSAKLRMACEIAVPAKRNGNEETVYEFGRRRLGESFAHYLLDPMVSGIFAGNARELSLSSVFPKMVEMETEYGGLFRAMIAKQKAAKREGKRSGGPAGAAATLTTFKDGMGELTEQLAAMLGESLETAAAVSAIEQADGHYVVRSEGRNVEADAVILACPSYAAADLIARLSPRTARTLREIQYAPVDVVCHGHARSEIARDLDGFGVLIPRGEGFRMLGCLWCDAVFPNQAPAGMHLLRTMLGGAQDPQVTDLTEPELDAVAHHEHRRLLNVLARPRFQRTFRHPRGIAQYTLGHPQRVAETERLEHELHGLFFTGASYRGVSVNGCVKDAYRVAERFWESWRTA